MTRTVTVIPARKIEDETGKPVKGRQRVAAYCRVSTDHEEQEGSFRNQVTYYTELIERKPEWELAGIFADEGISGTGTKKRSGFMEMIRACEAGEVDLVITKSISRFARNTADCLNYSRKLRNLGIPILFEKEAIDTMKASGELMFTILSSLAQEESRNISENTQWGIRSRFRQGIPHLNVEALMGYDKDADGNLVINEQQAVVVRRVFRELLEGWGPAEIARRLNNDEVPGIHGRACWHPVTIERMLRNEKHVGDMLMQKTYTVDYLTKTQAVNDGALEQYFIRDDHPAIVSRQIWEAAQQELDRREAFRVRHGIHSTCTSTGDRFYSRVFCGKCGGRLVRGLGKEGRWHYWQCERAGKRGGYRCCGERVREETLRRVMVICWNRVVEERTAEGAMSGTAEKQNALSCYRDALFDAIAAEGPLAREVPELTHAVLEEIVVKSPEEFTVRLLDGASMEVELPNETGVEAPQ